MALNEYSGLEDPTKQQGIITTANQLNVPAAQKVAAPANADPYGTDAYNKAFGLEPMKYAEGNANGTVAKPNTIGSLAGRTEIAPTMAAFQSGINPSEVYAKAGLSVPKGSYTGINNSWVPAGGANDTYAARDARIAALKAAGMSDSDARIEADNGFQIAETANEQSMQLGGSQVNQGVGTSTGQSSNVGIISGATAPAGTLAGQLGTPTQWDITKPQTVQGQLETVLNPYSPLIQQARATGAAFANDRGLMNSTIGQSASDAEMYKVALPIASADAATYAKAAGYNTDMSNQFAVQNFGAANSLQQALLGANTSLQTTAMNNAASRANAELQAKTQELTSKLQAGTQLTLADKEILAKLQMADNDAKNRVALANMDAATREKLVQVEANYKNVLQSNQSATNMYQQITQNIAQIQTSNLSEAAKQTAIANLETKLQESLSVLGAISGLNLADLVTVSTPTAVAPTSLGSPTNTNSDKYNQIWAGI